MSSLKPGLVVEYRERYYRVWDRIPLAGASGGHVLICTQPDGDGGWNGPRVAIELDPTVLLVPGDPRQLAGAR